MSGNQRSIFLLAQPVLCVENEISVPKMITLLEKIYVREVAA